MEQISREFLNELVGTKIKNIKTYQRAFTHKSALKRYEGLEGSYETLEFMGDSVLGFIVTNQEGSHIRMAKGEVRITLPNHNPILTKTLQSVLRQAGVSREDFIAVL